MPEELFRQVIAAAVVLACIAFVVQAAVVVAFYGAVRKMQKKVEDLSDRVSPFMAKVEPVIEKVGPLFDKAGPLVERIGPMMDATSEGLGRLMPVIDRTAVVVGRIGEVAATANQIVADARPRINELSEEAVAAAHSARQHLDQIGGLLHEATNRARARLEQIDESVGNTVGQVEQVGGAMKRAVMSPVRNANGLAAGISAAVATLVHPRKSSPDSATQDEEMFI